MDSSSAQNLLKTRKKRWINIASTKHVLTKKKQVQWEKRSYALQSHESFGEYK